MKNIFILLLLLCLFAGSAFGGLIDDFRPAASRDYEKIKIVDVLSADLIELENGEKIKLIGLKAPVPPPPKKIETDKYGFVIEDTSPFISMNQKAYDYAHSLLKNQFVKIEFDTQKKNDQFQTLGYVFLIKDNTFVNAEILRQGYARLHIQIPNTKYADTLREAYKEAKREKRGIQGE